MLSKDDCKTILALIGHQLKINPALISTRLLSKEDKQDMLNGQLTSEILMPAVKAWIGNGMPDYANGKNYPYKPRC